MRREGCGVASATGREHVGTYQGGVSGDCGRIAGDTVSGEQAGVCHLHRTGCQHHHLLLFLRQVEIIIGQFAKIKTYLNGTEGYLAILLKVIGITYICEFSSDICRDAGYQAVAGQIEVLGKLTVMFAGLPILFAVIEQIQSFL